MDMLSLILAGYLAECIAGGLDSVEVTESVEATIFSLGLIESSTESGRWGVRHASNQDQ